MSVRSSGRIGSVIEPIINPNNLHIDGFYCEASNNDNVQILLDMYVRDISAKGIIIDDHNNLSDPDELVRLQPVLDLDFKLEGKQAYVGKRKIGKVIEYAVDDASLFIKKIYVHPHIWRSLGHDRLTFDRLSVVEVTDTSIVFSGPEVKIDAQETAAKKQLATDYSVSASVISE